jgi:ureidoglycolate lyase
MSAPEYIFEASEKPSLPWHEVPLIRATNESVKDYGCLVDDPKNFEIEIIKWPQQGWRPIDDGTGDEGGFVEGVFSAEWIGDILYGTNEAVKGNYVLGWSCDPQQALSEKQTAPRDQVLLWHMNYHPDGGQLFFPLDNQPFIVPVALPGDDLRPEKVVAFWCDGNKGLYIHPNIWHEGIFPVDDSQRFLDRQGKVHARVSCNIGEEFGLYLSCPLQADKIQG